MKKLDKMKYIEMDSQETFKKNQREKVQALSKIIGKIIRLERKRLGLTVEKFAESTSLSSSYVALLERGERTPSLSTAIVMSELFNLPVSYFFGEQDIIRTDEGKEHDTLDFFIRQLNSRQKEKLARIIDIMFMEDA